MSPTSPARRRPRPRSGVAALLRPKGTTAAGAQRLLREQGFREPRQAWQVIRRLSRDDLQRRNLRLIFAELMQQCRRGADPDRVLVNFERLVAALPNPNILYHYLRAAPDRLALLARVFAHSQALADSLARDAKLFHFLIAPDTLARPREKAWLDAELRRLLMPLRLPGRRYDMVRRFRRRETLRIGTRDLIGLAPVEETTAELSNLADVCLQAVLEIALEVVRRHYRLPVVPAGATGLAIIGLGKLGGQELNYSSDVDVIFVYDDEGALTPVLSRREFFTKLAEEIVRAVGRPTEEGTIYRIDLRLRPEGASGPLVRALEACEHYYAQYGETWERLALSKARPVAGDPAVGAAFLELVQPFIYARGTGLNVIKQMGQLKARIESEIVGAGALTRHVKLGIGGIREIEFIVQSLQVMLGRRLPRVRDRNTLRALTRLAAAQALTTAEVEALAGAYRFLRAVEHRLQMEMELQTHTIPDQAHAVQRLARSLGFKSVAQFERALQGHTGAVRRIYESVLAEAERIAPGTAGDLSGVELTDQLVDAGFQEVPAAEKTLAVLRDGPGFGHISARTKDSFGRLVPVIVAAARQLAEPDRALAGLDRFVAAYGSRGLLYELLGRRPRLLEMVLRVADASRYLLDILVRQPDLFDEVCRGSVLSEPKDLARLEADLAAAAAAAAAETDDEAAARGAALSAARLWKQEESLRVGIEDVLGLVDLEQVTWELTLVGEACLRLAMRQGVGAVPVPGGKPGTAPLAVIGMGKFGGQELGYGADLDVLFVLGGDQSHREWANRVAVQVISCLDQRTGAGMLYKVDPRLRPDGEKGPLAPSLGTYREYYRRRAQLWERQALTKARWVAGDEACGRAFLEMVHQVIYAEPLTDAEWAEIRRMRHRIETERGDPKHRPRDFKTGPGGLVDVEFLVQSLQLRHGAAHPQLRTAHTLAALNRLTAAGLVVDRHSYALREGYLFLRGIESALRRMDNGNVSHLPAEEAELTALAKRLGLEGGAGEMQERYRATTER
ncbi:bifunctional [glutamate--ammonia ligase]-adenylyl-L-tyrosine phosphorylase/[glutamate--ammonia-ligase] adenylyltransferase, partial [bacterium]|nr:bifunctional [glutamate--ammonia ligase]-adenylyl-L-tyrosine phosphorylase/[glutamate--ammonia-ligase] adenylyltransferase [bacterium]